MSSGLPSGPSERLHKSTHKKHACPPSCSKTFDPDMSRSSSHSRCEHERLSEDLIASLDPLKLQDLALRTRKVLSWDVGSNISCAIASPPHCGGSNVVYKASFSDGVDWAIKIPVAKDIPGPASARRMRLDISTQRFIASRVSSMPIPQVHGWSCDDDNHIGRPYIIMDFLPGKQLLHLWNDRSWITQSKREHIFEQLAEWMTELAALEFPRIGRLDADADEQIEPFDPDKSSPGEPDSNLGLGPYDSAHAYISDLLRIRRQRSDEPMLAVLQLYTSILDHTLDGPPFSLHHPDLDSQNVLVADDGTITGILDWDDVSVGPRQSGAAAYPSWITVDWDPLFYGWRADASAEENAKFDSPDELRRYREMYLAAIDRASAGKLTHITRNSHVWEAIQIAIENEMATVHIVYHIHKFMFGETLFGYDLEQKIKDAPWYKMGVSQNGIAEVPQITEASDSDLQDYPESAEGNEVPTE